MKQLPLALRWHEIDWTDDGPPSTVSRPTEDAAIRNIRQQQRGLLGRRELEPLERMVYELELDCIRTYPHFITPQQRAKWITQQRRVSIYNLTPVQVMTMLDDITKVLENAEPTHYDAAIGYVDRIVII